MTEDERYMHMALQIASIGRGQTSPNPMVGAILVKDGVIVGQGAHLRAGAAHAEVLALDMAKDRAKGATAYVTLEPCNHFGRTPPCTQALIAAGVSRVVIAQLDKNPTAAGGFERLRQAGIEVTAGVLGMEAQKQNETYDFYTVNHRPFVVWKTAATLDGFIATETGHSQYVTDISARDSVQELRREHPAIAVGVGTVLADNPRLTVRQRDASIQSVKQPLRVIFDSRLRTPVDAQILQEPGRTVIYTTAEGLRACPLHVRGAMQERADLIAVAATDTNQVSLSAALTHLGTLGISSVLVEGGSAIASALLKEQLIDKVVYYIAPKLLGGGVAALHGLRISQMSDAIALERIRLRQFDNDLCLEGYPVYTQ